ncbi:glycosyltransferase [Geminocystis sp. CENA526]|uniref:glycosyltransferase n=1 Tax=Geminocystis sp. CENA526 TaxID=1355871 RepID=UPI003D6E5AFF
MQKKLKIALLVPSLNGGGAERVIVNLANYFNRQKESTVWIITTQKGVYFDILDYDIMRYFLPDLNLRIFNLNILKSVSQLISLCLFLIINKPDILMSTTHSSNILGPIAKILTGVKTKVVVRTANTFDDFRVEKLSLRQRLYLRVLKLSYYLADFHIANSPDTKKDVNFFCCVPKENIKVIPNPVYDPKIENLSLEKIGHKWIDNGCKYIVSAGRLHPQKDFDTLLMAFYELQAKHDVKLIILGTGDQEKRLKELVKKLGIAEKIDFVGFQTNPYPYFKNAQVFVLTSRWEGFGNVLVESLAVGTPIVSSDCSGGPRFILKDGMYGTLVNIGNSQGFADAIEQVLLNQNIYPKEFLIKRAKDFSIDEIGEYYFNEFISILNI